MGKVTNIHNTGNSQDDTQPKSVLERLLPILRESTNNTIRCNSNSNTSNPFRRRGIAGMIRNITVDQKENAWWLLNICHVLTPLLLPLMGPESLTLEEKVNMDPDLWLQGPDQIRDLDSTTRLYCVESILTLLATGRNSRQFMTSNQTYIVLKKCDAIEENEAVSDRIQECITLLRRDNDINIQEGGSNTNENDADNEEENTNDEDDIDIIDTIVKGPTSST